MRICCGQRVAPSIGWVSSEVPAALPSPGGDVVESAIAVLRGHGSRITPARRLLLTALLEPGHHSAGQIAAAVRAQAPGVHLTTVYRNLEDLVAPRRPGRDARALLCREMGVAAGRLPGAAQIEQIHLLLMRLVY